MQDITDNTKLPSVLKKAENREVPAIAQVAARSAVSVTCSVLKGVNKQNHSVLSVDVVLGEVTLNPDRLLTGSFPLSSDLLLGLRAKAPEGCNLSGNKPYEVCRRRSRVYIIRAVKDQQVERLVGATALPFSFRQQDYHRSGNHD